MNKELALKIYRKKDIKNIEAKILSLGNYTKYNVSSFCNTRLFATALLFVVILCISNMGYVYAPFCAVGFYYLFYYLEISLKIKKRTEKLDYEALNFFEILTLSLESGRNLEKALEITCDNVDGELSDEFKKALLEIKLGKSLIEALEDMKKRIPSETVNNIILNITQTNIFGNSILDTMYHQVKFLRDKQILSIREKINKIPNKVSILSVIFMVPMIIILILGPYLIDIIG